MEDELEVSGEEISAESETSDITTEDVNSSSNTDSEVSQGSSAPADSEPKVNPAWEEVLSLLPKEFHKVVTPHFAKWDGNFSRVQSESAAKYSPYEPIISQGIKPEQIQQAMQIMQAINQNPRDIFDRLGKHHGFFEEQGQEEENEEVLDINSLEEEFAIEKHPFVMELQQQVQALTNEAQARAQATAKAEAQSQVNSWWSEIEKNHGAKLTDPEKNYITQLTLGMGNGNLDLRKGYEQFKQITSFARNSSANSTAPQVMTGGGIPKKPTVRTEDNFEDRMEQLLRASGNIQ